MCTFEGTITAQSIARGRNSVHVKYSVLQFQMLLFPLANITSWQKVFTVFLWNGLQSWYYIRILHLWMNGVKKPQSFQLHGFYRAPAEMTSQRLSFMLPIPVSNCCTSNHYAFKLLMFADNMTLIGVISGGDESAYRGELTVWQPDVETTTWN